MAKLVTKFKYLKPNRKVSADGYAKYIATREGVEKIDDTKKFAPALGYGALAIIAIPLACIILFCTIIGILPSIMENGCMRDFNYCDKLKPIL